MARACRLLERFGEEGLGRPLTQTENARVLADSVLRHLRKMLNTRPEQVSIQPDYGMPDIAEFVQAQPIAVEKVQRAILNTVTKFEPRLRDVLVTHVSSEPVLRFQITGALLMEQQATLEFHTEVGPSRVVLVEGQAGRD